MTNETTPQRRRSTSTAPTKNMKTLDEARADFVALYVQDVQESGSYKARVEADPVASAESLIAGLDRREVMQLAADLRAERRAIREILK